MFRLLGACVWHDVGLRLHGIFTPRFGVDGLTAFFLGMLGLVAAPTLAYASRYFDGTRRGRANSVLTGAFVLVLAEVSCARDPISFLAGWELMTLLPAAIILVSRSDDEARRTVFLYLAITHLAGACTWVAVLLAADPGPSARAVPSRRARGFRSRSRSLLSWAWAPRQG